MGRRRQLISTTTTQGDESSNTTALFVCELTREWGQPRRASDRKDQEETIRIWRWVMADVLWWLLDGASFMFMINDVMWYGARFISLLSCGTIDHIQDDTHVYSVSVVALVITSSERRAEEHMICYVMCTHDVLEIDEDWAAGQDTQICSIILERGKQERGE